MKKIILLSFLFLVFIFSLFYLYKNDFKVSLEKEVKEIVNYDGNFKDKDENNTNFNDSIISGIIASIEEDFIYVSSYVDSNELRKILLDEDTKYFNIEVDSNYKELGKQSIKKEDIRERDSIVVVPKYSSEEGKLDFSRAEEVKIILVKNE